jgi:Protein of unknown function (DUF4236)
MGFYLRKSFRLGPLRLNLSKRGVGEAVGVTGARIGIDATGHEYVNARAPRLSTTGRAAHRSPRAAVRCSRG